MRIMIRALLGSLLLAWSTIAAADVIDCRDVFGSDAFVDPPRSAPVLHFVDVLPFAVRSFGSPTIDYTVRGTEVRIAIHQAVAASKSKTTPTCHEESLALPAIAMPTLYGVTCVYDITDDDGSVSTLSTPGILISSLDWNPVTLTAKPAAPTNQTPIQIAIGGATPNVSQALEPARVTVDGNRINIEVDVVMGGATMLGHYDATARLGFLPPGDYVVTSTSRTFVGSFVWPSFIDTAELRFTVAAAPRAHAVRH